MVWNPETSPDFPTCRRIPRDKSSTSPKRPRDKCWWRVKLAWQNLGLIQLQRVSNRPQIIPIIVTKSLSPSVQRKCVVNFHICQTAHCSGENSLTFREDFSHRAFLSLTVNEMELSSRPVASTRLICLKYVARDAPTALLTSLSSWLHNKCTQFSPMLTVTTGRVHLHCESKKSHPLKFFDIFSQTVGNF